MGSKFKTLDSLRQAACLLLCILFALPVLGVQPTLSGNNGMPLPEEREESNKTDSADDDTSSDDSIHQLNRRATSQRSLISRSVITDATLARSSVTGLASNVLKDVYQNGLGSRLRC